MLITLSRIVFSIGLIAVIALSVMPQGTVPDPGISDKFAHFAAYAALALAGGIACRGSGLVIILAAGLLLLGIGLEFVQAFIPGRSASGYDGLANAIGIALGSAAAISIGTIMNRRRRVLG